MPRRLPLCAFPHEWLLVVGIAFASLVMMQPRNIQDHSRLALTQALIERRGLTIEGYGVPIDRVRYENHLYTDKAPGLSFVAVPAVAAVHVGNRVTGSGGIPIWFAPTRLWLVRVAVLGPFLIVLALLVGRVAEGLVKGTGPLTAVAAALGTMLGALSSVLFAHVPAAALAFGGFVLLARGHASRSALAAGGLAGAAVLAEYEAGLIVAALLVYGLVWRGARATMWFLLGGMPAAIALGLYNWMAFESPLRLSYRYKDDLYAEDHRRGFFGLEWPELDGLVTTLVGGRGLLVTAPLLVLAAAGLVPFARRFRGEAALCGAVGLVFLSLEAGYFLPYGGTSPGPRFFAPALPFLLLGLPYAFRARPRLTVAFVACSVALSTANSLTWFERTYHSGWRILPETIWSLGDVPHLPGALLTFCAAAGSVMLAATTALRSRGDT